MKTADDSEKVEKISTVYLYIDGLSLQEQRNGEFSYSSKRSDEAKEFLRKELQKLYPIFDIEQVKKQKLNEHRRLEFKFGFDDKMKIIKIEIQKEKGFLLPIEIANSPEVEEIFRKGLQIIVGGELHKKVVAIITEYTFGHQFELITEPQIEKEEIKEQTT